ncbi:integrase/recombinase XerD [Halanaerobium congolense]|uniref:Integrase/recombinase XerD n=1 Tax=Halanaerobium congolense TaxID=54121 RepID=A0A1G8NJR3_9FIRM|nr:tyrosine-type recombinase/integrase [Halanaerobium congolense]KXS47480.1 MAG: site-specific recombinase XerD [Halanaerobium sp. T82-1]SDI80286.1 integrase/recombinase XerD [Halanaerobium congolense]SET49601.1 integrase/recombinase XerD [Halanaerobium congolense]
MPKMNLIKYSDRMTVEEAYEKFIKFCKAKDLSERTLRYYNNNFKRFNGFLLEDDVVLISQVDSEVITDYILHLKEGDRSNSSINTYLRATRAFLYHCMDLGYLKNFKIKMLRKTEKIKMTYTDEELRRLLKKPNIKSCGFAEYRNWVLTNWLLATGNRSRTVRNIKIGDLDLNDGYVVLREVKNKKQRIIPIAKSLIVILQEYLTFLNQDKDQYLFCSIYGEKLTAEGISSAIPTYNQKRGVDKTSIHLYRHTFAKRWIKNGGDIFRLQKILGHSNMEMVRKYVNMYGEDLKENFEEFNPINQFVNTRKEHIKLK